ncbi:MAG: tRNA pseudouridine(13) synthase TruD [Gammaproteobacteria bacterium]
MTQPAAAAPDQIDIRPGHHAFGEPECTAVLRAVPADFQVTEILGFEPSDEGPHALLLVEKTGLNTLDLLPQIARAAGLRQRDIGYCGLKDRHAVTRQWVSLPAQKANDSEQWTGEGWRVVERRANQRKLRLGAHARNEFVLRLTDLEGNTDGLDARAESIRQHGVPNYFGEQRFGHDGDNLRRARRWFVDGAELARRQRRFALSAARSWLFNRVLSARVAADQWRGPIEGEPLCLDGSRSFFMPKPEDADDVARRLGEFDVHPSGPLWGKGESPALSTCGELEAAVVASLPWLADGLAAEGLRQERRPLRLPVHDFNVEVAGTTLTATFALAKGSFATAVVHELARVNGGRILA